MPKQKSRDPDDDRIEDMILAAFMFVWAIEHPDDARGAANALAAAARFKAGILDASLCETMQEGD